MGEEADQGCPISGLTSMHNAMRSGRRAKRVSRPRTIASEGTGWSLAGATGGESCRMVGGYCGL